MKHIILYTCLILLVFHKALSQNQVHVIGQMKDVMWKGKLSGKLDLKSLADTPHLYGLGPVEFLAGEVLILNSIPYISTIVADSSMEVKESWEVKAPFFGYASIPEWHAVSLPESIQNISQ